MVAIVDNDIAGPRMHALVLGVSRYLHLDDGASPTAIGKASELAQLSSAARSASEVAAWLMNEYRNPDAPLASLHLSLAPSEDEELHPAIAAKIGGDPNALRASVMADLSAFRERILADRDAVAFVYVAGHGVQLTAEGATLLLEDYAAPAAESALHAALDMKGVQASCDAGVAARVQFWFVDTCREEPAVADKFETMQGAHRGDTLPGEVEASPMFLASGPRDQAWAKIDGLSLFSEALLACLRRDSAIGPKAAGEPWRITTASLIEVLKPRVLEASGSAMQVVELAGERIGTTAEVIHAFEEPPNAKLTVTLLPAEAQDNKPEATMFLNSEKVVEKADEWPLVKELSAGLYAIKVDAKAPFGEAFEAVKVEPPKSDHEVTVPQ